MQLWQACRVLDRIMGPKISDGIWAGIPQGTILDQIKEGRLRDSWQKSEQGQGFRAPRACLIHVWFNSRSKQQNVALKVASCVLVGPHDRSDLTCDSTGSSRARRRNIPQLV